MVSVIVNGDALRACSGTTTTTAMPAGIMTPSHSALEFQPNQKAENLFTQRLFKYGSPSVRTIRKFTTTATSFKPAPPVTSVYPDLGKQQRNED